MKSLLASFLVLLLLTGSAPAQPKPDTWVATDALGRSLPTHADVGPVREGKSVGIFYFLWHGSHGTDGPFNVSEILAADGEPAWGPLGMPHHWGEPELGYYLTGSEYVFRKHAQLLADAGVDVVIFDLTNGFTYTEEYLELCRVWAQVRAEGGNTPQISFLAPFDAALAKDVVNSLVANLYGPGLYRELWFLWRGKVLIMADPAQVEGPTRDFFTFRKPQISYFKGPQGPGEWAWLEVWPQNPYLGDDGQVEEVAVGVAQNAVGEELAPMSDPRGAKGRSWREQDQAEAEDGLDAGANFAEQWQRALDLDPEFVFVTGWNEWVASRTNFWNSGFRDYRDETGGIFVDVYNQEYSRDAEPMLGGHGDNYYYQLVDYIRQFKGVRAPEPPSQRTIRIDGGFTDWDGVTPVYADTPGDTFHRHDPGWGEAGSYLDTSGRNDLVTLKATRDSRYLYFYAETREPLSARTDPNWMLLFIDIDRNPETGWMGYDYLVNQEVLGAGQTTLKRADGSGGWVTVGTILFGASGNQLELAIPLNFIGGSPAAYGFDFHWADNPASIEDYQEFITTGDSAPNRRFNYRYGT